MPYYFASDFHLGIPSHEKSLEREKKIVRWLDHVAKDAEGIYLVGDIFDFWFDYKCVVPRGYVRLLGKLAELRDQGIPITVFTGNHDLWMFGYFEQELGIPVHKKPIVCQLYGKQLMIGHGDGLGPGDYGYKHLKKLFTNPLAQWAFRQVHPDFAMRVALYFSRRSRLAQHSMPEAWLGEENEWLFQYAQRKLQETPLDFFVFGHRHLELDLALPGSNSRYINLGEWMHTCSYAVLDETGMRLAYWEKPC